MRNVYVAGIGMTRFAKQPGRSLKDLTAEAVQAAMKDAAVAVEDVGACYFRQRRRRIDDRPGNASRAVPAQAARFWRAPGR